MFKTLLALGIAASLVAAPNSLKFSMTYEPNSTYVTKTKSTGGGTMDFKGDPETMAMLSKQMKLPMQIQSQSNMYSETQTGYPNTQGEIPFVTVVRDYSQQTKVGEQEIPERIQIDSSNGMTGMYLPSGEWRFDSIYGYHSSSALGQKSSDEMDQKIQQSIKTALNSAMLRLPFPSKAMKIGDKFSHTVPFDMDGEQQVQIKMSITNVYTLKSIQGQKGHFDIQSSIKMNMDLANTTADLKGSGSGKGKMIFDQAQGVPSRIDLNLQFKLGMNMGPMEMKSNMTMKSTTEMQLIR